jgi:hypothetical protein
MAKHADTHDVEKPTDKEHEEFKKVFNYDTDPRINAFSVKEQRKIFRRIDIRLVVTLGCMYMISLLDRTNLGAASVAG